MARARRKGPSTPQYNKPALGRGELQIIGATTLNEYRKHIERTPPWSAASSRHGQRAHEGGIGTDLTGLRDKYEAHHKLKITDEAIAAAVEMSSRYINDRFLPDKAIDLVDEAASRVRMNSLTLPSNLKTLENRLDDIRREKDAAVAEQNFEKAAALRDEETRLAASLNRSARTGRG
jgi:ATP-dependent Clp protease ATP-binding subunit ClpC